MDLNKLFNFSQEKVFTDLLLILIDDENTERQINVHRIILSISCPYFEKLLTASFKECNQNTITIIVPNANIAHDIIMSFYGQNTLEKDWYYLLKSISCHDFFGLNFDYKQLDNLEISNENFGNFLDEVDSIGYYDDKKLINLIVKKLPIGYDLSSSPCELINEISKLYCIASVSINNDIIVWNLYTGKIIYEYHNNFVRGAYFSLNNKIILKYKDTFKIVSLKNGKTSEAIGMFGWKKITNSPDGKTIAFSPKNYNTNLNHKLGIYDIATKNTIYSLNDVGEISSICYSSNNKEIAYSQDHYIKILNLQTGAINCSIYKLYAHNICYSNNKLIVSKPNTITIWNSLTWEEILTIYDDNTITIICVSFNGKIISSVSNCKTIKIWNAITGHLIHTLEGHKLNINDICYTPDDKKIISASDDNTIKIWDIETGTLINTLNEHVNSVSKVCCSIIN